MRNVFSVFRLIILIIFCMTATVLVAKDYYVKDYGAVGDGVTNDVAAIRMAVRDFTQSIRPSTLHFEEDKVYRCVATEGYVVSLENVKNKIVEGHGAELLLHPDVLPIEVISSENVLVQNLSFDNNPLPWTQGRITKVDKTKSEFTVLIDEDYPIPTNIYGESVHPWGMTWHANTDLIKNELVYVTACSEANGRSVVYAARDASSVRGMVVNDRFTIDVYGKGGWNSVQRSSDVQFKNVNIYSSRSMAFAILDNRGCVHMDGVNLIRRPGTTRLLSSYRDGFHCANNKLGPIIENCHVNGLCDDAIALYARFYYVRDMHGGNKFKMSPINVENFIAVGDTLLFFDMTRGCELGRPVVQSVDADGWVVTDVPIQGVVAGAYEGEQTTHVNNLSAANGGFLIRNNTFTGQRRYAISVRGTYGLIEGNVGYDLNAGIVLSSEVRTWKSGPLPYNVIIRNNSFYNTFAEPFRTRFESFANDSESKPILRLTVENNTFGPSRSNMSYSAKFHSISGLTLSENNFVNKANKFVLLDNCESVVFSCGNLSNNKAFDAFVPGVDLDRTNVEDVSFDCSTAYEVAVRDELFSYTLNEHDLSIRTDKIEYSVALYDSIGRLLNTYNSPKTLDLSDYHSGVYVIQFIAENYYQVRKIHF